MLNFIKVSNAVMQCKRCDKLVKIERLHNHDCVAFDKLMERRKTNNLSKYTDRNIERFLSMFKNNNIT